MAKVYSWQVSERAFAYIVDPNDTSIPRVGSEITNQKDLQVISDWAQNATDTQYDAQFEKMVTKCNSMGYNVDFETPVAYRTVATTCDNLRGPAGRGIQKIEYSHPAPNGEGSVYYIYYDDGWSDSIIIKDGKDGRDGIDGKPGAPGDSGVSSKLIMIYTSGVDADGNIIIPERPVGGSYDFIDGVFVCPEGWSRNDGDDGSLTPPIWQSTRTFASTEASTDNRWSTPVQITGENGAPGADGTSTEFIYCLSLNKPNIFGPNGERMESDPDVNGFVPNESWGFTASPQGVDEDNKCEWCCIRTKNKETGKWGEWTEPTIWSKYGENGQDGDGVQYIYLKNNGKVPVNPTPFGYDAFDSNDPDIKEVCENYQNKDTEWLPPVGSYSNYSNDTATTPCVKDNTNIPENSDIGIWTDDPTDVDNEFQYVWVSSRKYRKSPDSDKKMWTKFSDPTLWAKFGESGKNATSIRRLYALSPSTGNPPDLPKDSNFTADWGTGFPKDYKASENVVWATEAEIWAHNFEFVMSYRKVSLVDTDGNPIPPADATNENSKQVPYLPDEQNIGYTYLIYDKHYYKWDGGWCEPFLVTGVKGDPGSPINYTTYVFAFGYTDYPPARPISNLPDKPGESCGDNSKYVSWVDFPDTTLYRDGIQEDGTDMRWFQCEGHVDGHKGTIVQNEDGTLQWGAVTPCNPRDGEGKTGPYYQFLFGITKDDKEPITVFSNDGKWLRYPEYYVNNEQYGWFDTDDQMPAIPKGGAMWQIWALIDPDTDTVLEVNGKGWNGPRRISGEKGEQGLQGPAGLRGVSGLPGVAQHTMYCLGTYGRNTSEYYFDHYTSGGTNLMGDGYFGSKEYQDKFPDVLTTMGWYAYNEMPYSDIIQVVNDTEFEAAYKNSKNQGRVIRYKKTVTNEKSGSSFKVDSYQYFLVGRGGGYYDQLTEVLSEKENEDFEIYIWCIQGNDVYKAGKHKLYVELNGIPEDANENNTTSVSVIPENELEYQPKYLYHVTRGTYYQWKEIPGDEVNHVLERVEWSSPFKLQGTNGLRGLAGNRGQVVYPMGVYNHEEIYITTESKAPYVYDPNDGLFYVYNIVGEPWIGKLPENYKEVMIDMDGDGKTEYYKYSSDGSGNEGTWYTIDQDGDTPANNFANAGSGETPAWVRFESFQALYTNIGIIANGMIGSAVYNNEFMFSQQGIDAYGRNTNYAVVSGKQDEGGFLSGYKFDEVGKYVPLDDGDGSQILLHWYYRDRLDANNEPIYLDNRNVNPYEKRNGEYIHAFMPNVCINFSTGEMWLSCGKVHFDASGAGYLANQHINWTADGTVVIGKPGESENGIVFDENGMSIGPLNDYKLTTDGLIEDINASITRAVNRINGIGADGYVTPEEQKSLKNEKATIDKEYPSLTAQCSTYGLTDSSHTYYNKYTSYKTWYNRASSAVTYYTNPNNYASNDSGNTYYKCIEIKTGFTGTGTTGQYYGNIAQYYNARQELQNALTITAENRATTSAITSANTYTADQISGVTKTISDLETTIQGQMDKKADTWAVDYDPSTAWTTTAICNEHIGDIWYAKSSGYTYTFNNTNTNTKTGCSVQAATTAGTYYWVRSDVSLLAFDYSDGSSSIHYGKAPTGYTQNDMWFIPADEDDNNIPTDCKVKDTVVCTGVTTFTTNAAGVNIASKFTKGDWVKLDRYTDDTFATEKFNDWASDGKLSPPERKALKEEANAIAAESASTITQCNTYFGTGASETTTYKNAATYAYNTAMHYATGFTSGATVTISGATETTIANDKTRYANIKLYYKTRQETQDKLVNKIYEKSKSYADDKKFLEGVFGSVLTNSGATLTGYLGVTNGTDGVDNVVACIDGKGLVTDSKKGKLVLATGIPSGTASLTNRMKSATTKVYASGALETSNGKFSGSISSTQGKIGGLHISDGLVFCQGTGSWKNGSGTVLGKIKNDIVIRENYGLGFVSTDTKDLMKINISTGFYSVGTSSSSYGFDGTTNYETQMCYFKPGLMVDMVTTGTTDSSRYQYLHAIYVNADCSGVAQNSYAIYCPKGTYAGLRPKIRRDSTSKSITLDEYDHTFITNKSFGEGEERTVLIPKNPPIGQEYVIICPCRYSASLEKNMSKFHISISGGGTFYCVHDGQTRSNTITWKESTVECKLWWDGTYWWYSYNSWKA